MGIFDFLFGSFSCPVCGTKGARKAGIQVRCPNPSCQNFDASLGRPGRLRQAGTTVPTRGNYQPQQPITIRYQNFENVARSFTAEASTLRRKRNHIIAQVTPTGEHISLARNRIQNLAEVEEHLPKQVAPGQPWPTPRERQVLNYHKKYGTTSPLYEKVRAKYPTW